MVNMKTEVQYDGTTGEGVVQTILSCCERMTVKDKVDDLRVTNTTSRVEEGFGTRLLETSGDEGVIKIEACMIEKDNRCEDYRVDDIATNNKVKEVFVNNTRVDDDHGETSSTLDPETWALPYVRPKRWKVAARKRRSKPIWKWLRVARQRRTLKTYESLHTCSRDLGINRCKTQETEGGGGEAKIEANANNKFEAKMDMDESMADGHLETFPTLILETSAVASESQREIGEMGDGRKEGKTESRAIRKMARTKADFAESRSVKPESNCSRSR